MTKRICVVGAGRWGKNHVKTLEGLGALAGIVDAREETRGWFKEKFPSINTYATVEESLGDNFDGYTVATPAETHFSIAKTLLSHKKPVLVEKPLALHADEARELKRLADEQKVPLMVGHVLLFHPAVRKMKELIQSGKIGKLQYLYSNRLNLGTVRTEENILWSFAPHDISIFQHLIGNVSPREVISRGGAFIQPHIHDTTMTVLTYPNNVVGHIFVSWLHPFKEHRLVVIGSKGMLSFDDSSAEKQLLFFEKGIDWVKGEPVSRDGPTEVVAYERTMPLTEEMRYFLGAIESGHAEVANAASAVEVLDVLERASRSLTEGGASVQENESRAAGHGGNGAVSPAKSPFFVHPTSFVDDQVTIGEGTKVWHFSHVQSNTVIGQKVSIGQNVNIGNNVKIGNHVKIQNNVSVYEGVELEDYVFCGPSMVFTNVHEPRSKYPQRGSEFYRKTLVREGASIGANATIVCGNTIGRHAFIGAGAVVTKNVPDFALMVGNPARQIGWMCECGEKLSLKKGSATCSRCKAEYALDGDILSRIEERAEGKSAAPQAAAV